LIKLWAFGELDTVGELSLNSEINRVLAEMEHEKGKKALLALASERRAA